jgi:hypothetical protein
MNSFLSMMELLTAALTLMAVSLPIAQSFKKNLNGLQKKSFEIREEHLTTWYASRRLLRGNY